MAKIRNIAAPPTTGTNPQTGIRPAPNSVATT
jgi:hypothetical protein